MFKMVERKWGIYIELFRCKKLCIKILKFNPKSKISLQRHKFRNEWWICLSGWGEMTNGVTSWFMYSMDSVLIKKNSWHQFISKKDKAIFIEVQYGTDVRESDIERL